MSDRSDSSIAGRRALVSGGCSGIGLATAQRLRDAGARVGIVDLAPPEQVDRGATAGIAYARLDVREVDQAAAAVAALGEELGGAPELFVAAAGIYPVAPMEEISAAEWDAAQQVNVRGAVFLARSVRRLIAAGDGEGAMVMVSSIAAMDANAHEPAAAYNASKAGLLGATRQLAVEWAPAIRVNAVLPGLIATPMLRITDDPAATRSYLEERVPLRRIGQPQEVAALIQFLLSEESSYITGASIPIDGGALIT